MFECHENVAKQMLYTFAFHHPEAHMVKGTTLLISGTVSTQDETQRIDVKIIHKDDLKKSKPHFSEVKSVHVYSVQKCAAVDINAVQHIIKGSSLMDRLNQMPNRSIVNSKAIVNKKINELDAKEYQCKAMRSNSTKIEEANQNNEIQDGFADDDSMYTFDNIQLIEKYRPASSNCIIGQQGERSPMNQLSKWLNNWHENQSKRFGKQIPKNKGKYNETGAAYKCALISGPPGVGKTLTACLVSRESGFDLLEYNASDARSRKFLNEMLNESFSNNSVVSVKCKRLLLMDEIDAMLGDRGGLTELIDLIKSTRVPIICICNNRNNEKIRNLANFCFDLKFSRPRIDQIKKALLPVCSEEGIRIKPDALSELIFGCQQDVRQLLNNLSMIRTDNQYGAVIDLDQARKDVVRSRKTSVKINPWEACRAVFNNASQKSMSYNEKSDLFFHNRDLAGMFVQENYLWAKPIATNGNVKKLMALLSKAADSISMGDIIEEEIKKEANYGLLPTAAAFCSVLPGAYLSG